MISAGPARETVEHVLAHRREEMIGIGGVISCLDTRARTARRSRTSDSTASSASHCCDRLAAALPLMPRSDTGRFGLEPLLSA